MDNLLGNIYCWFVSFFGENLRDHLWGFDCTSGSFTGQNQFNTIGMIAIGIAAFLMVFYYYILNHPRFNKWWSWLIMLGVTGTLNFFIGYWIINADLQNGTISDCLMYVRDENGSIIQTLIVQSHCWGFGIANMLVSIIFFVLLSLSFKWWSTNAKHSPIL